MSALDGHEGTVDAGPTPPRTEVLPVAPVLVRDYRRLLRLFPYTYRRAHEAEMLSHLLDGATPGQSRPSRAERADLLRAAAREWLLAPLGSAALQRRRAITVLSLVLPVLLAFPASKALLYTADVVARGRAGDLLDLVPLAPSWLIWVLSVVACLAGAERVGRWLMSAAVLLSVGALVVRAVQGDTLLVYLETGWVVGQAALLLVLTERVRSGRRTSAYSRVLVGVGIAVVLALAPVTNAGPTWGWSGDPSVLDPTDFYFTYLRPSMHAVVLVLGVVLLLTRAGREALPVLAGVGSAVVIGRIGIFGSRSAPFYGVYLDDVLVLLAASLVVTVASRWLVNRVDEIVVARARHRDEIVAATATPPGDPTAG